MKDLRARFIAELDRRRVLSLATLRPDGWPQATIVGYVNDGPAIYFMISRESQKFANLTADPRVSICVGEDVADPMAIGGASMAATVAEVTDSAERARAMALMFKRYPEYEGMMKDVDTTQMGLMRATPFIASVLTYEKGFGHTDELRLAARPS
ncbi:MAG TPA: pyridoxamine 5'-phosphate oxidase family protein [Caulobacter sp.]|nr:pyridoxamine 5'-phosphate oxidase family protein [Caulobacter sp.]